MSNQFIPDNYQEDPNTKAYVDQVLLELLGHWENHKKGIQDAPQSFLPEEESNSGPSASSIAVGLFNQLIQTTPAGPQAALPEQQFFLSDIPFPSQVPSFTAAVPSSQTSNAIAGPIIDVPQSFLPEEELYPYNFPLPYHNPISTEVVPTFQTSEFISGPSISSVVAGPSTQFFQTTPAGPQAALPKQQSFPCNIPVPYQVPSFTTTLASSQTSNAIAGPSRFPGALEPPTNLESSVGPIRTKSKTNVERWYCEEVGCGLNYSTKSNLESHKRRIHKSKDKIPCYITGCDKKYSDINGVRRHLKRFHNIPKGEWLI
ncbi:hypothetical protein DFH28DRAFT_1217748 [Melampsora americana]|nr:hypothetical protein DFH28DRAFT_1217748 [Melampsora americana]